MIVSMLYKLSRTLPSVPAMVLRRSSEDRELLAHYLTRSDDFLSDAGLLDVAAPHPLSPEGSA
jgi:hypothetical protein